MKSTIMKSSEIFFRGDMPTPDAIFCTNPPNYNKSEQILEFMKVDFKAIYVSWPKITTINTLFKVIIGYPRNIPIF